MWMIFKTFKSQPLLIILAGFLFFLPGCDKPVANKSAKHKVLVADFKMLASLRANQKTQMVAGVNGQVYFVQPETDGASIVRMIKSDGQIVDTDLTAANISKFIGKPNSRGIIRAIAPVPGAKILLYYAGTDNAESLASLLIYDTELKELHLAANTTDIATQSGLGVLLDIADIQIACTGEAYWIWLSHVDANVFLRIGLREIQNNKPNLSRPFEKLLTESSDFKLSSQDTLYGDFTGGLWISQEQQGRLWRVAQTGRVIEQRATPNRSFSQLPPLGITERNEQNVPLQLHFFPSEGVRTPDEAIQLSTDSKILYPALEVTGGRANFLIDRTRITIRSGFPLHALRISSWQPVPNNNDVIAYDAMSGEIFRINLQFE